MATKKKPLEDEYVEPATPTEDDAVAGMGDVILSATKNGVTDVDEE